MKTAPSTDTPATAESAKRVPDFGISLLLGFLGISVLLGVTSLSAVEEVGEIALRQLSGDETVQVDGIVGEWKRHEVEIDGTELRIAGAHDNGFLYLTLLTRDTALQRQILRGGLTVWLDGPDAEPESFGIRFPLPLAEYRETLRAAGPGPDGDNGTRTRSRERRRPSLNTLFQRLNGLDLDAELLGSGATAARTSISDLSDADMALDRVDETWAVEFKIPLADEGAASLDAAGGDLIHLGIEIPAVDEGRRERGRGGRGVGQGGRGGRGGFGGPGGFGGARGGSGGGGPRAAEGRGEPVEPVDLRLPIRLEVSGDTAP